MWEKDPAGMREALELHNSALHGAIEAQGGQVFKIIGDEFQAVFVEPLQAVEAAVAAQRALAIVPWGRVGPLRVRMGIHTGQAVATGGDYEVSHTFNRTARIMSAGHGGQILLSVDVVDQLNGNLPEDVSLQDMGRQRMKGMTLREHLFQIRVNDLEAEFPPLKTEDAGSHDLPEEETPVSAVEPPLEISLLGEFSLRHGERIVSLETPSHQSLLAYLVIHVQRVHSRQQLAFQFWPDSGEGQARTNLRKAIYVLRHTLPDADRFLTADRQTVRWRTDASCAVDAWAFETAVKQAKQAEDPLDEQSYLEQAIDAYQGDFMPGHYDEWVLAAREKLRHQYLASLEKLILIFEEERQYAAAIDLARKLLREDPLHETAYRRLMRLQALDNNVAGALRTYHACSTRLQRELGVDPSRATQELYERLLQAPAVPAPLAPSRLPLVAREEAWQTLQRAWQQCYHEQPGVVLLRGEAGIGKTRLAEELLDWVERQGIVVLTAVCYPSDQQLAYAPVAKCLRNESLHAVFRRLDKRNLVECSRLLPELSQQNPDLPAPRPLSESWQRQHLFSALAQTLLQVRQPFLLFIDDLQWCDQDTLDWLLFLLRHDPQSRFLVLGTARSEEITLDHPLTQWQPQLDREGRLTTIRIERLDAESSAQLAEHVVKQPLDSQQANQLYAETEGNPLFVVEMARAALSGQPFDSRLPQLPVKVQAVIESRLASLSPSAQALAQLAAVIGQSFTYSLLNQACVEDEDKVIRGLDELWQRRIVRERGVEAYDFSHDKIRLGAYETLSLARRRQLHQQVWRALETLYAENLDPVSGQIAAHCDASGHYQEAVAYYHQAAQVAQAVFANQDAVQYLQRAIDLFPKTNVISRRRVGIYEQLGDVLTLMGCVDEAEEIYKKIVSHLSDIIAISRLHRKLARIQLLQRHFEKAFLTLNESEGLFENLSDNSEPAHWQEWLQRQLDRLWLHYWANEDEEMGLLAQKLNPIIKKHGTKMQRGIFFQRLVLLSFRQDRFVVPRETVQYAQESLDAIEASGELSQIALAHFVLGFASLWHGYQGELDAAEVHLQAALKQAEEIGDVVLQCRCLSYLPLIYRKKGDVNKTRILTPPALALAEQCQMFEYIANARGNFAWIAWRDGDLAEAQKQGQAALTAMRKLPHTPLKWIWLWPLLAVALANNEIAPAVSYAQNLLEPNQYRLPDDVTAVLQQAVTAFASDQLETTRDCLQRAVKHAQQLGQL